MDELALLLLVLSSVGVFVWGLKRPERIYQFPFVISCVFVGLILPEAYGLYGDTRLPAGGYALTMVMAALCMYAIYAGFAAKSAPMKAFDWKLDDRRLLEAAAFLSIMGASFNFILRNLPEEQLRIDTGWTGVNLIYLFFALAQNYGFGLAALCYARKRSRFALILCLFDFAWFFGIIVVSGRRSFTTQIILTMVTAAWFGRRWVLPRPLVVAGFVAGVLMVNSIGQYRALTNATYGGENGKMPTLEEFMDIDFLGNTMKFARGEIEGGDLRNGVYAISATNETMNYNLGAFYWNALVFRYVPRQLVGDDVEAFLTINLVDKTQNLYGYEVRPGECITGMADLFAMFGLFGAFIFYLYGRVMRTLWDAAMGGNIVAQLTYGTLLMPGMISVTHASTEFVTVYIHFAIFALPALMWARLTPDTVPPLPAMARPGAPEPVDLPAGSR